MIVLIVISYWFHLMRIHFLSRHAVIRWLCILSVALGSLRIVHRQWPFSPQMQPVSSRGNTSLLLVDDIWKRHETTYYWITWAYCTSQFKKRWSDVCGVKILCNADIRKLWTELIYFIQRVMLILYLRIFMKIYTFKK